MKGQTFLGVYTPTLVGVTAGYFSKAPAKPPSNTGTENQSEVSLPQTLTESNRAAATHHDNLAN